MTGRLARLRRDHEGEDGFALMYVLFVTTLVLIGTASMLTVAVGNIVPARKSQDTASALAAAQSGIQDFVANLNARCRTLSIQSCDWLSDAGPLTATIGDETYTARAVNREDYLTANDGVVRIVSSGTSGDVTRTLTADVSGVPSVLRFAYFSNYETLGTTFLDSYYPARSVRLTGAAARAVGLDSGSLVRWNGTGATQKDGYTDQVCDRAYYDESPLQGRATLASVRTGLDDATDFREDGSTQTPLQQTLGTRTAVSRDVACEVSFSKGMSFNGPVYSHDALLVTYGEYGSTTGPQFAVPAAETLPALSTGWTTASNPAAPSAPVRSDRVLGGVPTVKKGSATQAVQSLPGSITLPTSADPRATCVFTGPTRIVLAGTTATITSPLTASSCVDKVNGTFTVPVTRTTVQVKDAAAGTAVTGRTPTALQVDTNDTDITDYSKTAGDAYVQGNLTGGRISIVTSHDIVVTGDVTTQPSGTTPPTNAAGEPAWTPGTGAVALVATNDVRAYHPVACASGTASGGYCPNDISGLYTSAESGLVLNTDGSLADVHPAKQYTDLAPNRNLRIDGAVMALNGSLRSDNFNRGGALGTLTVNGGVYQSHRGAVGQLWEAPTVATTSRPSSGYKLQISYVSYAGAGLPYVPVLDTGNSLASPWIVLSVATGGTP